MQKQSSILSKRVLAGAVPALAVLSLATLAYAGDPIQVSSDKSKPGPVNTQPVDKDVFKSWNKTKAPASPLNSLTPFIGSGQSLDPRDERRLKNARDEKKNWMLLEPGELQKRDEEDDGKFGGRSVTIDKDSDDQSRNYLFYNATQDKSDRPKNPPQHAPADTDDGPKKDTHSTLSVLGPREVEKPGAHTASELNLKNLIDPSQVNATKFNQNEASLFQFLKDNAPTAADRDQQARRESFRDFINGPQPNSPPSGVSDPINFRTDLTQERMNPIMPQRAFELPASKPAESFLPQAPLGAIFTPGRAQPLPDMITARTPMGPALPSPMSPFLMQNDPAKAPKAGVMGNNSLFNRETPAFRR